MVAAPGDKVSPRSPISNRVNFSEQSQDASRETGPGPAVAVTPPTQVAPSLFLILRVTCLGAMSLLTVMGLSTNPSPLRRNLPSLRSNRELPMIVVGSHHKSGTGFSFSIIANVSRLGPVRRSTRFRFGVFGPAENSSNLATFYYNERAKPGLPEIEWIATAKVTSILTLLGERSRLIHLVRDPVEMIVSAYLYHLQEPKEEMWWLNSPGLFPLSESVSAALAASTCAHSSDPRWSWSWLEVLKCVPESEGIVAEGWKMIKQDIEPMATLSKELDCSSAQGGRVLNLDIDDVGRDFESSLRKLLSFVGVDERAQARLVRELEREQERVKLASTKHVTSGKYDKERLRGILLSDTQLELRLEELRSDLTCRNRGVS